jgi:hypothetical protein
LKIPLANSLEKDRNNKNERAEFNNSQTDHFPHTFATWNSLCCIILHTGQFFTSINHPIHITDSNFYRLLGVFWDQIQMDLCCMHRDVTASISCQQIVFIRNRNANLHEFFGFIINSGLFIVGINQNLHGDFQ